MRGEKLGRGFPPFIFHTKDPTQDFTQDLTKDPTQDLTQYPTQDLTQDPTQDPTQDLTQDLDSVVEPLKESEAGLDIEWAA